MTEPAVERLQALARTDPVVAPLVLLQAEALRESNGPAWEHGVPDLWVRHLAEGVPLLEGLTLAVDRDRLTDLLRRLAALGTQSAPENAQPFHQATSVLVGDPLGALEASVTQDFGRLQHLATDAGVELSLLTTFAQVAALPLLQACGRRAAQALSGAAWPATYCPVCAAWPTLAELRGLHRERWLRCGRCGAGWSTAHQTCVYCGNTSHETLSYLAADGERDVRRAEICERCRGYLKTVATLGPLAPGEILVHDASTLELDVTALQEGYGRPEKPGFGLHARVEALSRGNGSLPRSG